MRTILVRTVEGLVVRTWGLAWLLSLAVTSTGCAMTATMIPVEGPLSQVRPAPVLQVRVDGILGNSGKLSFTMPDGEACNGRWASAAGAGVTVGSAGLLSQYGSMYVSGYSVSTGTGQNPGQALALCSKGRTLQLEFVTGAGTAHGFGIGKDNEGNIYRFVF
jgi:hypothetical protein